MKLSTGERVELFDMARKLSPSLGALFQNPMEITPEMLNEEIAACYRLRDEEMRRWETYKWKLGDLLCFPDKPR